MNENNKRVVFHPMPGKLVVERLTSDKIGNLYLPPSARDEKTMGTVIAIGSEPDILLDDQPGPEDLKVGDVVLFGRNSGVAAEVDRQNVFILRSSEVLARLTWEDASDES